MKTLPDVRALQAMMDTRKLDAIVCTSPENFTYLAGAFVTTIKTIRPRQAHMILTRDGRARVIVCSIEESLVREEGWCTEVRGYTEFADDPVDELADTLMELKLGHATLGLDLDYLPAASFARLQEGLPHARLLDASESVAAVRAIKSEQEIALLEKIAKQTHGAILWGFAESRVGDTDRTIANRIIKRMFDEGANGVQHLHLASGPRTPLVHNHPSDDVTQSGEILRLDIGGTYGQYASDVARTCSTGEPLAHHREVYRTLIEIQRDTIGQMHPGVAAEDIYFACRDAFEKHGLPCSLPHIGHSFGIEAHERPMIRPGEKILLQPGMVINIEPMTRDQDGNLYHTEDLVVITADGCRLLTHGLAPLDIPVLGEPVRLPY